LKALILAGGFGTRLRPLSCTRPKILFPIVNKPLLQWTFEGLAESKVKDVILAVFYQTEVYIKHHRIPRSGLNLIYSHDPLRKPLGTGGSIKKAQRYVGHSDFIVLNGDIFADVEYTEILKLHKEKDAVATIALHQVEDPSRYGVAELEEGGRIRKFLEKPQKRTGSENLINAGVYVLSAGIFDYIPENRPVSIEREVFPRLADEGTLFGYVFDGLWQDIGKPADYLEINKALLASFENHQKKSHPSIIKMPVALDRGVHIGKNSIVGPDVVLGRNVSVGRNVRIWNSVVLSQTAISDSSSITGAIIGEGVFVGENVTISEGCIIGDHAKIRDKVSLAKGVSVCPAKEIREDVLTSQTIS
jgi:mannose-1-phosphate guanylyltransferase